MLRAEAKDSARLDSFLRAAADCGLSLNESAEKYWDRPAP